MTPIPKYPTKNMTSSKDTILVLMDKTEDLLQQGIRAVKSAQAVDQIVPPMKFKRKALIRNSDTRYFACLKREVTI